MTVREDRTVEVGEMNISHGVHEGGVCEQIFNKWTDDETINEKYDLRTYWNLVREGKSRII